MNFYDHKLETLDKNDLRQRQNERLRLLVGELAANEFYRAKAHRAGIKLESIESAEDLLALPFTTKAELVEDQQSHPPFGRLLTYPLSNYRYFHQTTATTGRPPQCLASGESWGGGGGVW